MNEIINKSNQRRKLPSTFLIENQECSDPVSITNHFCKYFSKLGSNLAKKIPNASVSPNSFLSGNYANSMFFELSTEQEIAEIVNSFRNGVATGYDNLSVSAIKESVDLIACPLTHIVNLSISSGIFPDPLKITRVVPVFKSGDRRSLSNYRPISVLPIFSKVLERVVYNRLLSYMDKFHILIDNQFGFRKDHSASLALLQLYDKISLAIDQSEFTIGIFLDLSKAFDTVNHNILFDKLQHYGIRGTALNWFKSYFSNRMQFVQYNGVCSQKTVIECGVPQGSILGPLLFLIYINDICNVSSIFQLILFADDTNVFCSGKNLPYLMNQANRELNKLSDWFTANKLSVNLKKTKFMIFKQKQKRCHVDSKIFLNNQEIDLVKEISFLGVILDEHLTWKSHISHVARKMAKSIGIIKRASFCLSKSSLTMLYYSLVYPYMQYRILVLGSTYPSNLHRIVLLQKRIIRIVCKAAYDANTEPIFKELGIFPFEKIYLFHLGKFMYLHYKQMLPINFNHFFLCVNQVHNYNTRNSNLYFVPFCRTNIRQFSVIYQGVKFSNSLPRDIYDVSSILCFNKRLKEYLL